MNQENKHVKIISWNINGLGGMLKKDVDGEKITKLNPKQSVLDVMVQKEQPDIICLQEIRCSGNTQWEPLTYTVADYDCTRKGSSGVLISSNLQPISQYIGLIDVDEKEGRAITLEFDEFFLLNLYSPNTGSGYHRMNYRIQVWEPAVKSHIASLQERGKYVIVCGDLNVVPQDIDYKTTKPIAGTSIDEKKAFASLLSEFGYIDTFRTLHPKLKQFSWGKPNTRLSGTWGARLDYFLTHKSWLPNIHRSGILNYIGSDHAPIVLEFEYTPVQQIISTSDTKS